MSASPLKADIASLGSQVRCGPEPDTRVANYLRGRASFTMVKRLAK